MRKRSNVVAAVVLALVAVGALQAIARGVYAPFIPIALVLVVAWAAHYFRVRRKRTFLRPNNLGRSAPPVLPRHGRTPPRPTAEAKAKRKPYPFRVIEGGKRDR